MDPYAKLSPETADVFRTLDRMGLKQRELAVAIGIEENKISKVKAGERQLKVPELLKARDWLAAHSATDAGAEPLPEEGLDDDADLVEVQELDLTYGMGGGTYLDLPVKATPRKFSRTWLRMFTDAPPSRLFFATGSGDSMMPTILDADIVMIDTTESQVRMADKIWAIAYGQTGMIKRLRPLPDGSVKILSDNPSVPLETAYDGELSVVGRVVAIIRKT